MKRVYVARHAVSVAELERAGDMGLVAHTEEAVRRAMGPLADVAAFHWRAEGAGVNGHREARLHDGEPVPWWARILVFEGRAEVEV